MVIMDDNRCVMKGIDGDTVELPACRFFGCKGQLKAEKIKYQVKERWIGLFLRIKLVPTGFWKCTDPCFLVCGVNGDQDDFFEEQERSSQGMSVTL